MVRRTGVALCVTFSLAAAAVAATRSLTIVPAQSRMTIEVGKAGVFSFAGHAHEVVGPIGGRVTLDPEKLEDSTVRIEIDTTALKVSGKGEPPDDVPKVQQAMERQVLDIARYPTIAFESTAVTVKNRSATAIDLTVNGRLTLHGVTRSVSAPVSAEISADALKATGRLTVKQTDYGIKPVSVGGVVNVKDALNITFTIVAR